MKYEKPVVAVVDFAAMQRIAYIPENNGEKTAMPANDTPSTSFVGGEGEVQGRG